MHRTRAIKLLLVIAAAMPLYGCGEGQETEDVPETLLPDRPEDKIVESTDRIPQIDADPTPQTGTGGTIPGYDPADVDQSEIPAN